MKKVENTIMLICLFTLYYRANYYIIENNFKFFDDEIRAKYIKIRKQLIRWFIQCNTQDENGNDEVDIIE